MGEIKSVKVDNWGVFFLQKLQNFFNKTDYCDLTLQFRDNSQLKVHRLVLSACTDYFNVLEQTCEVVDDAIIMPMSLQADVVVPIVNFMYTGTLEFELKMYSRLLRTAKDMNMTVLLKLLEAHRRTMEMHPQKSAAPSSPNQRRKTTAQTSANLPGSASGRSLMQTNQGKRVVIGSNTNVSQRRVITTGNTSRLPTAGNMPIRQIGSTTFTRIKQENDFQEANTQTGYKQPSQQQQSTATSPFEQLRKGYNNNKRPAVSSFVSPPTKKPNLEDVKEFAEQQRMRKQIAAEYGDDDYDASNIMDDDTIHNDDDDDEIMTASGQVPQTSTSSASAAVQTVSSQPMQQQQSEDPPGTTTIIVKHEGPDKPPTIVVKDGSNSKMNHTKIISEVLRQYPHLIKSNKNIKLKIMPNAGGQAQKIIVKKEPLEQEKSAEKVMQAPNVGKLSNTASKGGDNLQQPLKTLASNIIANRPKPVQQSEISASGKLNNAASQLGANKTTAVGASNTGTATTAGQPQKRRIDSKTMHALIALGAENTTGPWLCLRCGRNGHPISIPSYRGFRRHLINTHKETIDPALCEHCGWRSSSKRELHFHMQLEHKIKTNLYIFPECQLCKQMCIDSDGLNQHLIDSHPDENKQQCIYCNKIFPEEIQLYTHMKTFHKKQALEDGIIDYSDDENQQQQLPPLPPAEYDQEMEREQQGEQKQEDKKIKILSDISLPIASSIIKTESFITENVTHQESAMSTASEEYLQEHDHSETKFVAADGSEVILTAEQRKEILSQLSQEHGGSGVVMVLNENQEHFGSGETQSDQGAISQDETSQATTATNEERAEEVEDEEDEHDDNQIYREMKSVNSNIEEDSTDHTEAAAETEAPNERVSSVQEDVEEEHEEEHHEERSEHLDESKESMDNLEWAENLISEHDLAEEASSQAATEAAQSNKIEEKEEEIKDEDNKSQDEISKKLKELTGDWSEDDDEDLVEDDSFTETAIKKEKVKDQKPTSTDVEMAEPDDKINDRLTKEIDESKIFTDHAELLASLQSAEKVETEEIKDTADVSQEEAENIDEDDIDIALKSLHKEDNKDEKMDTNEEEAEEFKNQEHETVKKEGEPKTEEKEKANDEERNLEKSTGIEDTDEYEEEVQKVKLEEMITQNIETENTEEELAKQQESAQKSETVTAMDVDEKTKKDLIDSLLKEQAETMENTAAETTATTEAIIKGNEDNLTDTNEKSNITLDMEQESAEQEPALENEFLNVTPEKVEESEEKPLTTTAASSTTTSTSAITTSTTTQVAEASSSSSKEATITSEERVKSLISEWGDDEDDDDNDADLTANL